MRNCFFQFLAALCLFSYALPAHAGDAKAIAALTAAGAKVTLISGGGTRVDVPDGKLSDDLWKSLEALGDLKVFSVKGTQFNNAAVEHLSKIATIEAIVIYNPGFDDKGLAMLANLPELKSINIDHGTTINGSGLAAFAGKKLEKFNIGGSKVDDAGMAGIGKVSQLKDLTIRHVHISSVGFANFGKITGLKQMTYSAGFHIRVTEADLQKLTGLKELQDLTLSEMVLTYDGGLAYLKPLQQLKKLTLNLVAITDADLAKLKADHPDAKIILKPATPENIKYYNDELAKLKEARRRSKAVYSRNL